MATGGAEPISPTPSPATEGRLDSWKEIASYLKRSVRTVTRWEREQGLPVHRHKTGTVYAYKPELDAWWASHRQHIECELPPAIPPRRSPSSRLGIPAAIASLILVIGLAGFVLRPHPTVPPKLVPLTTYPGTEGPPSLSPDGNQVTFHRNGHIFVKQADGEEMIQLTNTSAADAAPAWSPDGRHIAFIRDGTGIFLISPLGGGEKRVTETHARPEDNMRLMAWTPDSRSLIISELTSPICASLFSVLVETGEKRRLTWPPEPSTGDRWPSVSPDGKTLAFARFPQDNSPNVHVMPLAGGQPRRITSDKTWQWGLTWTPDGREVVYSSERTGAPRLWRISPNSWSKSPSPVEGAGENARFPSFSHPGAGALVRLAYQRFVQNISLRHAEIIGAGTPQHALGSSSLFAPTTMMDAEAQFSPDGKKIAFSSTRSGAWEIWVCDSNGSNLLRLTSMGGPPVGGPRWSPDGRRITFFGTTGSKGEFQIYVVDAAGGSPRRLSRDDGHKDFRPSWSPDGRWIYFGSTRSGTIQVWKIPADGGTPMQITKRGGAEPLESPDERMLYYTNVGSAGPGLSSVPIGGGEEVHVLNSVWFGHWAVTPRGIYFIDFNVPNDERRPLKFFDFQSRQTVQIGTVEKEVTLNTGGLAVSPDCSGSA
jgi:Tol biopolymer transport system component